MSGEEVSASPKKRIRWSPTVEEARSSPIDAASLLFASIMEDTKEPTDPLVHRGCNRPACNRYWSRRSRQARAVPRTIQSNPWSHLRISGEMLLQKDNAVSPPYDISDDHTSLCDNSDDDSVLSYLLSTSPEEEDGSVDEEDSSDISRD